MGERLRHVARELTPPVLFRAVRSRSSAGAPAGGDDHWDAMGGVEAGPEWYDERFAADPMWRAHYTKSPYYHFWTVIADRLVHDAPRAPAVLEIGCGSGQLASALRDWGVTDYVGFDFAPKRVEWAEHTVPEFRFEVADAFTTSLYDDVPYDVVVCTEFLEHVERDLDVLSRLLRGRRVIGTVPNFGGGSHVRHFDDAGAVRARYRAVLDDLRVDSFPNRNGRVHYLLDGIAVGGPAQSATAIEVTRGKPVTNERHVTPLSSER
jgi:SAM-dependent methyltransferase